MVEGAAGISQQWRNSIDRLPMTLRLPHGSIKERRGGGGGGGGGGVSFSFFSFPSSSLPALFPLVPWLPTSVPEPLHCHRSPVPRACSCPAPTMLVPCSHPRPEPSDPSPETCSSASRPVPAVPSPSLQPTASAAAAVAAQTRACRALVQPVRAHSSLHS